MILEELIGGLVSLLSSLVIHKPPISRENLESDYSLINDENPEQEEHMMGWYTASTSKRSSLNCPIMKKK